MTTTQDPGLHFGHKVVPKTTTHYYVRYSRMPRTGTKDTRAGRRMDDENKHFVSTFLTEYINDNDNFDRMIQFSYDMDSFEDDMGIVGMLDSDKSFIMAQLNEIRRKVKEQFARTFRTKVKACIDTTTKIAQRNRPEKHIEELRELDNKREMEQKITKQIEKDPILQKLDDNIVKDEDSHISVDMLVSILMNQMGFYNSLKNGDGQSSMYTFMFQSSLSFKQKSELENESYDVRRKIFDYMKTLGYDKCEYIESPINDGYKQHIRKDKDNESETRIIRGFSYKEYDCTIPDYQYKILPTNDALVNMIITTIKRHLPIKSSNGMDRIEADIKQEYDLLKTRFPTQRRDKTYEKYMDKIYKETEIYL